MIDITIEKLIVWAYRSQRVLELETASSGFGTGLRSSMAAFEGLQGLGVAIRPTSGYAPAADAHPDALAVHAAASHLDEPLVIVHGRLGSRPEWGEDLAPRFYPMRTEAGKPRVIYLDAAGLSVIPSRSQCSRRALTQYCPVRVRPSAAEVAARADQYRRWAAGLVAVYRLLLTPGALRSHRLVACKFTEQAAAFTDAAEHHI